MIVRSVVMPGLDPGIRPSSATMPKFGDIDDRHPRGEGGDGRGDRALRQPRHFRKFD
jgi:hypothetical protein